MLREHPYLCQHVHALVEAAASVGAAPIQIRRDVGRQPDAGDARSRRRDHRHRARRRAAGGGSGWRSAGYPCRDTFAGPGRSHIDPTRQLITAIRFPIPATPWGTAWRRAGRRPSLILPTLNCAVKLVLDERWQPHHRAAIGMGPVGLLPHRAADAEAYLIGRAPDAETFAEAARLAEHGADPRTSIHRASRDYRLADPAGPGRGGVGVAAVRARREYVMT